MSAPERLTIDEVLERHRLPLFDAYGVLVDGSGDLPGAVALLSRLDKEKRPYFIVTNDCSRLPDAIADRFASQGLPVTPDHIVSAGSLLAPFLREQGMQGARLAVLGPVESFGYLEDVADVVPWHRVDRDTIDGVVITDESGYPFLPTVDAALSVILAKLDRGQAVELVVPNPDLIYPQGEGRFGFAAGSIAGLLEAAIRLRHPTRADIAFHRLGKPYPAIFAEAVRRGGTRDAVMIGDQLETDVRGAVGFGIKAALVTGGVSGAVLGEIPAEVRPHYIVSTLS